MQSQSDGIRRCQGRFDLRNWKPPYEEGWNILRNPPITPWLREQSAESSDLGDRFFLDLIAKGEAEHPTGQVEDGRTIMLGDEDTEDLLSSMIELGVHTKDGKNYISIQALEVKYLQYTKVLGCSGVALKKYTAPDKMRKYAEKYLLIEKTNGTHRFSANRKPEACYVAPTLAIIRQGHGFLGSSELHVVV